MASQPPSKIFKLLYSVILLLYTGVSVMREKTMRLSQEEWRKIEEARGLLLKKGYGNLPFQAEPDEFTKGAIVGLGIAALIYLLSKER